MSEEKTGTMAQRVMSRSDRRMRMVSRIEEVVRRAVLFLHAHPVFLTHFLRIRRAAPHRKGYTLTLELNEETYVSLSFYVGFIDYPCMTADGVVAEEGEEQEGTPVCYAEIPSVYSSLGHSTGFFLLHMAMAIAVACDVVEIRLDNDTDDPVRAIRGIYRLFVADLRTSMGPVCEEIRNRQAERVHVVQADSMRCIQDTVRDRVRSELQKKGGVWKADAVRTVEALFSTMRMHPVPATTGREGARPFPCVSVHRRDDAEGEGERIPPSDRAG